MNSLERFEAALTLSGYDRIPIPGMTQHGTLQLMEASNAPWPEAHRDPEIMARLAWAAHEIAGLEGVRLPFDFYIETEAVGTRLFKWKHDNQPMVEKFVVEKPEDIDNFLDRAASFDPKRDGRCPIVLKASEILLEKCRDAKIPLTTHAFAPFSACAGIHASLMVGSMFLKRQPDLFLKLQEGAAQISVKWARALAEVGSNCVFLNDSIATQFSRGDYEKYALPLATSTVSKIKETGVFVIIHACGDSSHVVDLLAKTGVDGVLIGQDVDMAKARRILPEKPALIGNVNPIVTLFMKKPEDVLAEAKYCIENGSDILNPGCGYSPKTPLANMKAMVEAAKRWGANARLAKKR